MYFSASGQSLVNSPMSVLLLYVLLLFYRLNFSTAYSSNAVSICKVIGITSITRIEISMRYLIRFDSKFSIDKNLKFKVSFYFLPKLNTLITCSINLEFSPKVCENFWNTKIKWRLFIPRKIT